MRQVRRNRVLQVNHRDLDRQWLGRFAANGPVDAEPQRASGPIGAQKIRIPVNALPKFNETSASTLAHWVAGPTAHYTEAVAISFTFLSILILDDAVAARGRRTGAISLAAAWAHPHTWPVALLTLLKVVVAAERGAGTLLWIRIGKAGRAGKAPVGKLTGHGVGKVGVRIALLRSADDPVAANPGKADKARSRKGYTRAPQRAVGVNVTVLCRDYVLALTFRAVGAAARIHTRLALPDASTRRAVGVACTGIAIIRAAQTGT